MWARPASFEKARAARDALARTANAGHPSREHFALVECCTCALRCSATKVSHQKKRRRIAGESPRAIVATTPPGNYLASRERADLVEVGVAPLSGNPQLPGSIHDRIALVKKDRLKGRTMVRILSYQLPRQGTSEAAGLIEGRFEGGSRYQSDVLVRRILLLREQGSSENPPCRPKNAEHHCSGVRMCPVGPHLMSDICDY